MDVTVGSRIADRYVIERALARGTGTERPPGTSTTPTTRPETPPPTTPAPAALVAFTPADGDFVPDLVTDVTGRVEPASAAVRVQGMACPVAADGTFSLTRLSLQPGPNRLVVDVRLTGRVSRTAARSRSRPIRTTRGSRSTRRRTASRRPTTT